VGEGRWCRRRKGRYSTEYTGAVGGQEGIAFVQKML
jgi:hypothetical protein